MIWSISNICHRILNDFFGGFVRSHSKMGSTAVMLFLQIRNLYLVESANIIFLIQSKLCSQCILRFPSNLLSKDIHGRKCQPHIFYSFCGACVSSDFFSLFRKILDRKCQNQVAIFYFQSKLCSEFIISFHSV